MIGQLKVSHDIIQVNDWTMHCSMAKCIGSQYHCMEKSILDDSVEKYRTSGLNGPSKCLSLQLWHLGANPTHSALYFPTELSGIGSISIIETTCLHHTAFWPIWGWINESSTFAGKGFWLSRNWIDVMWWIYRWLICCLFKYCSMGKSITSTRWYTCKYGRIYQMVESIRFEFKLLSYFLPYLG